PERRYVRSVLPRAFFAALASWGRGADPAGLQRAGVYVAVLGVTAAGYFSGRRLSPGAGLQPAATAAAAQQPWREAT
ncbi:MAG TPA: glycosyltransferase family 2 protein, partial [Arthrobacter sp.]|nr:glycosyltransferase family 2 protein [Arthrobacter sp.]